MTSHSEARFPDYPDVDYPLVRITIATASDDVVDIVEVTTRTLTLSDLERLHQAVRRCGRG